MATTRKETKRKGGRKKLQLDAATVEKLAADLLTEEEIAAACGVSQDTLARRKKETEGAGSADIAEAIKRGRMAGRAAVKKSFMSKARRGNLVAQIFFLKTQCGWKETTVVETGEGDVQHDRDTLARRVRELASGGRAGAGVGRAE